MIKQIKSLICKNNQETKTVHFLIQSLISSDRSEVLYKNLISFPEVNIFKSVNGYNEVETISAFNDSKLTFHNLYNHESLRYGVLANFLTKFKALQHQIDNSLEFMCLIEDDVYLDTSLIQLVKDSVYLLSKDQNLNTLRFGPWGECYLWSLDSAKRVVEKIKKLGIINNIDNQLRMNSGKELHINYDLKMSHLTNKGDCLSTNYIDLKKISKSYLDVFPHAENSKNCTNGIYFFSQNGSDKYLYDFVFKNWKNGFYIDIGSTNGINSNNTLFLENHLNWKGILIEPSFAFESLFFNRGKKNIIKKSFLSAQDGQTLSFGHCQTGCFGGDSKVWDPDSMEKKDHVIFSVQSKTLYTLLDELNLSTQVVDLLSISTNGCELSVIKGIHFDKNVVKLLLVKNNNSEIHQYLNEHEFIKVVNISSYTLYVNNQFTNLLQHNFEDFPKWSNYW
jgi:hypothetical protein